MQKSFWLLGLLCLVALLPGCNSHHPDADVVISTEFGNIEIKLYDDTPKHKANFLKLAKEGFYDGTSFHRIIKEFMIQGGDPQSKDTTQKPPQLPNPNEPLLDAEISTKHIHKKGALAAARTSGQVNPEKKSSGTQFYIVQGKKFTDGALDTLELMQKQMRMRDFQFTFINRPENEWFFKIVSQDGDGKAYDDFRKKYPDSLKNLEGRFKESFEAELKNNPVEISKENRNIYKMIGGAPQLDNDYTVFGEVVSGLEIIDKIAAVETDDKDKPKKRIPIKVQVINK